MLNILDLETAFAHRSNSNMRCAWILFTAISSPVLVRIGKYLTQFAVKLQLPLNWLVKPTLYRHFVGGETLEECNPVVSNLARFKVRSILDYSVEGSSSADAMEAVLAETLRSIEKAKADPNVVFAVFKPTAFASEHILEKASSGAPLDTNDQIELAAFRRRVHTLCNAAAKAGIPILIDAEDCHFQNAIDQVTNEMMELFNKTTAIVFNTYQMYRTDRIEVLKNDHHRAIAKGYFLGAKFVRGAYMERERQRAEMFGYPSPIHSTKADTDRDYNAALAYSIEHIDRISIFNGTHNEESCLYLARLMEVKKLAHDDRRVWSSQLYGMSEHISFNMAKAGYNVAKYVPYGPVRAVLPYLIRRAEENRSISGQTSRELALIRMELKRRKYQNAATSRSIS